MHQHNVRYALLPSSDVTVEWRGKIHQLNTKLLPVIIDWGFACSRHLRGACSSIFDEITEYTKDARREGDVDFGHFMRCISLINIGKKLVLAAVVDALQYASGAQTAESVIAHVVINHVLWSSWVVFDAEPPHFAFDPNVSTGVSHSAFFARGYKRRPDRIFCRSIDMLDLLLALRPVVERRGTSHFALDPCAVAPPAGEYEDNIDVADGHGNTMLHLHLQDARNFDRSSVMSLIARGANINAKNNNGETPLHIAVLHSQPIEVVNALIAAGADVNAADNHGITLLFLSVTKMTEQITYALLSAGARVDVAYPVNGNTVLHAAVSKYDVGVLRALIERGADVNAKNASSKTPLHIAVSRGNVDFARELVKGGADVNTPLVDGATCLHIAILSRNDALAALLIRAGAHVNAKMPTEGETPLHAATRTNMVDIVRMLIANGANVNGETTLGKTALHIAVEDNKSAIVAILIDNGANVNAQTFSGIAPLHISVANQHIVITQMLVSAGANVQLRKRDGTTPMDIAMRDRLPEIVAILSASKTAQLAEDEYGDEDELISPISDFTDDDDDDGGGGRAHSSAAAADAAPHT
jgi:ankyrin repeat protein